MPHPHPEDRLPTPVFHEPNPHLTIWPLSLPVQILRSAFQSLLLRPLLWLLLKPQVETPPQLPNTPTLLIANHVTLFDVPLILYALPSSLRSRLAVAADAEMLREWRTARGGGSQRTAGPLARLLGPLQYWLLTALFNLFPLPRDANGLRAAFDHIGSLLDCGGAVLLFPEGRRSPTAELQPFRKGIGLLAREAHAPILPVALANMPTLLVRQTAWFHAGLPTIRIGHRIVPDTTQSPEALTDHLHASLAVLLNP